VEKKRRMVRAFHHQISMQKSKSFHFRRMFEIPGKHIQGLFDKDEGGENKVYSKSLESRHSSDNSLETQPIGIVFNNDHAQVEAPKMPPKPPSGKKIFPLSLASLYIFNQDCT
jgi:hypothetical protein